MNMAEQLYEYNLHHFKNTDAENKLRGHFLILFCVCNNAFDM